MNGHGAIKAFTWAILGVYLAAVPPVPAATELTLKDAWQVIKTRKFVDLTHAFAPGIPHWQGFPDEKR